MAAVMVLVINLGRFQTFPTICVPTCCYLLFFRHNQEAAGEADALITNAHGCPNLCVVDSVLLFIRNLGLAGSFKAAGVRQSDLSKVVAAPLGTYFVESNLKLGRNITDTLSILEVAWKA